MAALLTPGEVVTFQTTVWEFFNEHQRNMPWRQPEPDNYFDPYKIMVSEVMLQQTQVVRVIPKFDIFIKQFPTVQVLANAQLGEVLRAWQGLGYNRRAKFLWQAAQKVITDFDGEFPQTDEALRTLPGVGINTAGAILTYAFNQPVAFIETNIRTVFIHHFFSDRQNVSDSEIYKLVESTLDRKSPREWFWAVMDYGSYLKSEVGNVTRASNSYTKQSPFVGSRRQIRGQVIGALSKRSHNVADLKGSINDERLSEVLASLQQEGLICFASQKYKLS